MPPKKITFDTVRQIAGRLSGVEESTIHGSPSLKVRGKLLACVPVHKSAEPDSLAVRIDCDSRADLIAADPDVYYLTDHYLNYPFVLVRMLRIEQEALRDLLGNSWQCMTAKGPKSNRHAKNQKAPRSRLSLP